ncbi:MAG: radical SAM protein, partial [Candidatus Verstraetearchaeota archaeon]|nr:radical SAM protein [Candidatus Verstraetearchaeota archaeon]
GPNTRVLCITEIDPLGIGPATSTFKQLFGGSAYMELKFKEILDNPAVRQYKPRIIVGGAGAWQLEGAEVRRALGVDCVVIGEGEGVLPSLVGEALNGAQLPEVVHSQAVDASAIPVIQGGSVDGIVEIARGCGRGCSFCLPTLQRFRCLPIEHILREVELNLRYGRSPLLHAEDVLRYKAKGYEINGPAVRELFESVRRIPGVEGIGVSHFALSSVASAPDLVEEISTIIAPVEKSDWMGVQVGLETGSPKLIKNLMAGKAKPFTPEEWPEMVENAFQILKENNWVPVSTIIIGLPGETDEDVQHTIDLVSRLKHYKSLIVPLFMVSEGGLKGVSQSFALDRMTRKQGELFLKCWEHNLDWAEVLIKGFFVTKRSGVGYGLKLVLSYGIKQARKLIHRCQKEYECDLYAMIKDVREGRLNVAPLPFRLVYPLLK